jgi:hypothetical protein
MFAIVIILKFKNELMGIDRTERYRNIDIKVAANAGLVSVNIAL